MSDHPSWSLIVVFNLSLVLFQTREVETFLEKNFFCFNLFYIEMAAVVVGQSWRNLIQRRTSLEISLTGKLPTEFFIVVVVISIKRLMIMRAWSSFETLATNWLLWKNPPTKDFSYTSAICLKRWNCKYKFKHVQKSQIV